MEYAQKLPQIRDYIRKSDTIKSDRLILCNGYLWSAKNSRTIGGKIRQWDCEGQCIRTLQVERGSIDCLLEWKDCLYIGLGWSTMQALDIKGHWLKGLVEQYNVSS